MSFNQTNISRLLILLFAVLLSACSESKREPEESTEPNAFPIQHPLIIDGRLYDIFNPDEEIAKERNTAIVSSDQGLMVPLDTDQSATDNVDGASFLNHTPLPEFVAYVLTNESDNKKEIHLYDLDTQHDHLLAKYPANEYICDIRNVITVDDASLKENKVLYKDELSLYVLSSVDAECTNDSASFVYNRLDILEKPESPNSRNTYDIRIDREVGTEDCEGEAERLPDDPDDREQCPNIDTVEETHPILIGKRRALDKTLFNAGSPIVDTENQQFGYLALDTDNNTLRFYEVHPDTLVKSELWSWQSDAFDLQATPHSNNTYHFKELRDGTGDLIETGFDDWILINHGWDLVRLNLEDLFDDDRDAQRLTSFNNPILSRTPLDEGYEPPNFSYNPASDLLVIADGFDIYSVAATGDDTTFVRRLRSTNLEEIALIPFTSFIGVAKRYTDGQTSLTSLNLPNGDSETTIIARTSDAMSFVRFTNGLDVNRQDQTRQAITTQSFTDEFESEELESNLLSLFVQDKRASANSILISTAMSSASISDPESPESLALHQPIITTLDFDGGPIGSIPSSVWKVLETTIYSDTYGVCKIVESSSDNAPVKTYYFNPGEPVDPDTNLVNSMKLVDL